MHGCRKEAGNTAERIIPDYYLTTIKKIPEALRRNASGIFLQFSEKLPNPNKTTGPQRFPI